MVTLNKVIKIKSKLVPYSFIIIPLFLFLTWVIGPMLYSFYLSFTDWDGFLAPQFVGIKNYSYLINDPTFYISLLNNLKWLISFITIPIVIGLMIAIVLNRKFFGAKALKTVFFLPYMLSFVAVGLIWGWMYHPASGLLNGVLNIIGLDNLNITWLSDPKLSTWCIIAAVLWRQVGYVMLLYLAGLQAIDTELIDAGKVDGTTNLQLFRHIILPQLRPMTTTVVIIMIIDSLRSFDAVYIMTSGGPANSSSVLGYFMYNEAFAKSKMGYGAAISIVILLIAAVFIFIYLWRMFQREEN